MNKKIITLITIICATTISSYAAVGTFNASLTVDLAISVTNPVELNLGVISVDRLSSGTVTLSPAGDISNIGTHLPIIGYSAATIAITGNPNETISTVSVTTSGLLTNGVSNIAIDYTNNSGGSLLLDATGVATFNIGATVTIDGSNAILGAYTGSFQVTVDY